MYTEFYWRSLLTRGVVLVAGVISAGVSLRVFFASTADSFAFALAAFAVAGVLTLMPWQLSEVLGKVGGRRHQEPLVRSGCWMAVGSILFLAATVAAYPYSALKGVGELTRLADTVRNSLESMTLLALLAGCFSFFYGLERFVRVMMSFLLADRDLESRLDG